VVFDGLGDQGDDVGVLDSVDLVAALRSDDDQPGESQFRKVLADRGDCGSGGRGEAGDVALAVGE